MSFQDKFCALYHETSIDNFRNILEANSLKTGYSLKNTKTYGFTNGYYSPRDQFPGLYFSLLEKNEKPRLEEKENILLVFPIYLMTEQKNWHYNITDRNGGINYDTYFHENIDDIPTNKDVKNFVIKQDSELFKKEQEKEPDKIISTKCFYPGNEIIFHDDVSLELCAYIYNGGDHEITLPKHISATIITKFKDINYDQMNILKKTIKTKLSKNGPIRISYSDFSYTGIDIPFYNKPDLRKMDNADFRNLIVKGIVRDIKLFPNTDLKTIPKTKNKIDKWITENNILETYFEKRKSAQQKGGHKKYDYVMIGARGGKYIIKNEKKIYIH